MLKECSVRLCPVSSLYLNVEVISVAARVPADSGEDWSGEGDTASCIYMCLVVFEDSI